MNPSMIDQHTMNNLDPFSNQNLSIGGGGHFGDGGQGGLIGGEGHVPNNVIQNPLPPQPTSQENKNPNINHPLKSNENKGKINV